MQTLPHLTLDSPTLQSMVQDSKETASVKWIVLRNQTTYLDNSIRSTTSPLHTTQSTVRYKSSFAEDRLHFVLSLI
jgi:hypothetical protein